MKFHHSHRRFAVLFPLLLALNLSACKDEPVAEDAPPVKWVKTMVVEQGSQRIRYFTGLVEANNTLDMNFRIAGELTQLPIKSGQRVSEGQLLAQLDNSQQLINVKSTKASLKQVNAEYKRAKTLKKTNVVSQANLDTLEAQAIGAQAAYDQSFKELEYTRLTAPFAGVISNRYVDNFSKVTSSTKILTLQDIQQYKVKITVPQSIFAHYQQSDVVEFSGEVAGFEQPFTLTIDEMSVSQDSSQQLQLTLLMQPPKERRVFTGTSVKVKALVSGKQQSKVLPSHAVLKNEQGHHVFVVLSAPNGNVLEKRQVEIGGVSERGIIVSSGLQSGERVVTAGVSQVHDGMQVVVNRKIGDKS